jgi:hypothetical protein
MNLLDKFFLGFKDAYKCKIHQKEEEALIDEMAD